MLKLSELATGVPYRQRLETVKGRLHDNFYLLRGSVVKCGTANKVSDEFYLFTTKEILTAIHRFENDVDRLPPWKCGLVLGYVYPVTYHNHNGVLTARHIFHFQKEGIPNVQLSDVTVSGLFSAREMKRAQKRVREFINPSWLNRWIKSVKLWLFKLLHK